MRFLCVSRSVSSDEINSHSVDARERRVSLMFTIWIPCSVSWLSGGKKEKLGTTFGCGDGGDASWVSEAVVMYSDMQSYSSSSEGGIWSPSSLSRCRCLLHSESWSASSTRRSSCSFSSAEKRSFCCWICICSSDISLTCASSCFFFSTKGLQLLFVAFLLLRPQFRHFWLQFLLCRRRFPEQSAHYLCWPTLLSINNYEVPFLCDIVSLGSTVMDRWMVPKITTIIFTESVFEKLCKNWIKPNIRQPISTQITHLKSVFFIYLNESSGLAEFRWFSQPSNATSEQINSNAVQHNWLQTHSCEWAVSALIIFIQNS